MYQIHEGYYPNGLSGASWRPATADRRRKADAIQAAKDHPYRAVVTRFCDSEVVFDNMHPMREE